MTDLMNHAALSTSLRLQRVLSVLSDGQPHSTMDIITRANVCAVNSIVAELREQGIAIRCQRQGAIWYYTIGARA